MLALPLPAGATVDIHGAWLVRDHGGANSQIVDVTQVDDAISFTYRGLPGSGTLSPAGMLSVSGQTSDGQFYLEGDVSADGERLNASLITLDEHTSTNDIFTAIGMRCGCVDGNFTDGDGCDAECQVEPCWTCSGTPSTCVPAGDGSACARANQCVTGATCTAGICTGGSLLAPCVDATGTWDVHAAKDLVGGGFHEEADFTRTIRQRAGHLLIRDAPTHDYFGDVHEYFGDIDATTGAMSWTKTGDFTGLTFCGDEPVAAVRDPFSGAVTSDARSFTTTGTVSELFGSRCHWDFTVMEEGARTCPEGTPCSSGDVCVTGETCHDGSCQGGEALACPPCEQCNADTGCTPAPAPTCTRATRPSALAIKNGSRDARDRIGWRWQSASAVPAATLGNPLASDGFSLCLFDVTPATPTLLFRSRVPGGGTCGTHPCWRAKHDGPSFTYRDSGATNDGTRSLRILDSARRGARARFSGRGTGLSGRPFGLPTIPLPEALLVQLQADGGACFESRHTSAGIRTSNGMRGRYRPRAE
jgi:hypothetical protein